VKSFALRQTIGVVNASGRGELEITDVNNAYIERNAMTCEIIERWWSDAGTIRFAFPR